MQKPFAVVTGIAMLVVAGVVVQQSGFMPSSLQGDVSSSPEEIFSSASSEPTCEEEFKSAERECIIIHSNALMDCASIECPRWWPACAARIDTCVDGANNNRTVCMDNALENNKECRRVPQTSSDDTTSDTMMEEAPPEDTGISDDMMEP